MLLLLSLLQAKLLVQALNITPSEVQDSLRAVECGAGHTEFDPDEQDHETGAQGEVSAAAEVLD